ncbi:HK97 family phage prohead protease [Erythrobacter sp.]|jgi:HK97 family phage prohead protease|uniref:HK97 family phage prohead protease n=1 Tax=Erythrobacter sp. TaxID=1042 RepID=UPI002EB9BAF7|nr:HK97 family phage prohead protease [Erythrobacter sp.]
MAGPAHQPLRFAGYAGLFDIPDADRDTIRKGAFETSIAGQETPFPLLWQHRANQRIGTVESVAEDAKGLRVIGRIEAPASLAANMLAARTVSGLSFGYRATRARHDDKGRELLEIELFEVSIVTHPLQHGARIHLIG